MPCKGAYLAAVRGTVGQHPLSLVFYDCNFRPKDWYAFLPGFCVVYEWYLVDQPDFMLTGCPVLHY
jgi:hypothetical protein